MDNISISIFQPSARDQSPEARLSLLDLAADRASSAGSVLLICPELSLSGYDVGDKLVERTQPVTGEYSERVAEIAQLHDLAIVYGFPELENGTRFNTAAMIAADGRMLGYHRKIHLPPGFERSYFSAGTGVSVFDFAGWRVALLVCYDVEFPEAVRQAAMAGAELIIVPTALAREWHMIGDLIVPARAWENGVFLVYANWAGQEGETTYLGGSRIVGPDGITDAQAGAAEEILTVAIDKVRVTNARARLDYLGDLRRSQT